jgi:hypothetical protein
LRPGRTAEPVEFLNAISNGERDAPMQKRLRDAAAALSARWEHLPTETQNDFARSILVRASIRMTLSLAFLCPALARTAIDGRPPRGFGVKRLMDLPMAWSDQWSALGLKDLAQATFSSAIRIHNSA